MEAAFGEKQSLQILLLGLDYNYDSKAQRHTKGARSDTIVVVRVEPLGRELSMLSLPRDLLVKIGKNGEHGYERINAAHALGGEQLTIETVQQLTGLKIDHFVAVKSDVVASLVDSIGGVPIHVEKQMDWDDHWAGLHIHLKPGQQRLSGSQAVGYCRFRQDEEGDFGRIERQQKFLTALLKELKGRQHWAKYPELAKLVKSKTKTNLEDKQLVGLAQIYKSFPLDNVRKGRPEVEDYLSNGGAYLVLAPGEPKSIIEELFTPLPSVSAREIAVVIKARDEYMDEARRVARLMKQRGFASVLLKHLPENSASEGKSYLSLKSADGQGADVLRAMFPQLTLNKTKTEGRPEATLQINSKIIVADSV